MNKIFLLALMTGLVGCTAFDPPVVTNPDLRIGVMSDDAGGYRAVAPECPSWSHDRPNPLDNLPQPNYGCATARNLAQMIENPKDLVAPGPLGPTDAVRNAQGIERLRGDKTRGLYDPNELPTPVN